MNLRLDIDVQKLEIKKLRKGKSKAEEELDSLKTDYKKLRLSMRTTRNEALEKSLSESQKEKGKLKDRVTELERSLHQYRNRNSAIELRACLSKIEEMRKRIEELEMTMQNCEIRIKYLEANESRNNEQLHYFQNQVRSRDHIMEEAVVQIREVGDHIQTLAVQADMLSVKYELESDRGHGSKDRKARTVPKRNAGSASTTNERAAREDSTEYDGQNDGISGEYDD
ncbi:hypothetical protein Gotur_036042 [Gossypium turneri]